MRNEYLKRKYENEIHFFNIYSQLHVLNVYLKADSFFDGITFLFYGKWINLRIALMLPLTS